MADFDLFKVKVIDRYFSILEKGLTLTKPWPLQLLYYRTTVILVGFRMHK